VPSLTEASLSAEERRVVDRLVGLLRVEFGADLHAVWLYGSRARGERPHLESDVDLLVLTSGGRDRDLLRAIELKAQAADEEGAYPLISVKVYDPEWLRGRREIDSFFIREVDRDKIVLHGRE
jgi:predicted nucleotidyltransferase